MPSLYKGVITMIIIKTVYISATNTKGARIKATLLDSAAGYDGYKHYPIPLIENEPAGKSRKPLTATIGYPHELSGLAVFMWAAENLLRKYNLWQQFRDSGIYLSNLGGADGCIPVSTERGYDFITPKSCNYIMPSKTPPYET
jgi:hypothetical protein